MQVPPTPSPGRGGLGLTRPAGRCRARPPGRPRRPRREGLRLPHACVAPRGVRTPPEAGLCAVCRRPLAGRRPQRVCSPPCRIARSSRSSGRSTGTGCDDSACYPNRPIGDLTLQAGTAIPCTSFDRRPAPGPSSGRRPGLPLGRASPVHSRASQNFLWSARSAGRAGCAPGMASGSAGGNSTRLPSASPAGPARSLRASGDTCVLVMHGTLPALVPQQVASGSVLSSVLERKTRQVALAGLFSPPGSRDGATEPG